MQRLLLRLIGFCVRLYYRTNRFGNEVPDGQTGSSLPPEARARANGAAVDVTGPRVLRRTRSSERTHTYPVSVCEYRAAKPDVLVRIQEQARTF